MRFARQLPRSTQPLMQGSTRYRSAEATQPIESRPARTRVIIDMAKAVTGHTEKVINRREQYGSGPIVSIDEQRKGPVALQFVTDDRARRNSKSLSISHSSFANSASLIRHRMADPIAHSRDTRVGGRAAARARREGTARSRPLRPVSINTGVDACNPALVQ